MFISILLSTVQSTQYAGQNVENTCLLITCTTYVVYIRPATKKTDDKVGDQLR